MVTIRSLMLLTTLSAPVVMIAVGTVTTDSLAVPLTGIIFSILSAFLIAALTTHSRSYFIRKLIASGLLSLTFFSTAYFIFWTWSEDRRLIESDEWSPVGIEVMTVPFRGLSAIVFALSTIGLFWMVAAIEVPEPL